MTTAEVAIELSNACLSMSSEEYEVYFRRRWVELAPGVAEDSELFYAVLGMSVMAGGLLVVFRDELGLDPYKLLTTMAKETREI